jgi:15-cis-phytoene synthase
MKNKEHIQNQELTSQQVFENASKTFYTATKFFPEQIRKDVTSFYAFVRIPDNYIDSPTPDFEALTRYKQDTQKSFDGKITGNKTIDDFGKLARDKNIKVEWINSFFAAMEQDKFIKSYEKFSDLEKYIYGSAEVIGLVMARMMNLPEELNKYAQLLGKSMQLANFIRDIPEDLTFGRIYIPQEDLERFHLKHNIVPKNKEQTENFEKLMRFEIQRYREITREASIGINLLPKNYRIPVKTASDMYSWTMDVIYKNPLVVFDKKVKPSKPRIVLKGFLNLITA